MRRFSFRATVSLIVVLLLAACSSPSRGSSAPVILTFWYTEESAASDPTMLLVQAFNASHPTIQVKAQRQDIFSIHDQFLDLASVGETAPDIVAGNVQWTAEYASKGVLYDLDGKIGDTADFLPAALAYGMYQGHLYSVPQTTDFIVMYYNKALLANMGITLPPATFADLNRAALAVTAHNPSLYGFATPGTTDYVLPFIYANGGDALQSDGKTVAINSAAAVAGLNQLLALVHAGAVLPIDGQGDTAAMHTAFKDGRVAIIFGSSRQAADLHAGTAFTGAHVSDFGIAAIPRASGGNIARSPAGGLNYAIYAGSSHKDAAVVFLNYLTATQHQLTLAATDGVLPARLSALNNPAVRALPLLGDLAALAITSRARPVTPVAKALFSTFDADLQQALQGNANAQTTLDKVASDWEGAVQHR